MFSRLVLLCFCIKLSLTYTTLNHHNHNRRKYLTIPKYLKRPPDPLPKFKHPHLSLGYATVYLSECLTRYPLGTYFLITYRLWKTFLHTLIAVFCRSVFLRHNFNIFTRLHVLYISPVSRRNKQIRLNFTANIY